MGHIGRLEGKEGMELSDCFRDMPRDHYLVDQGYSSEYTYSPDKPHSNPSHPHHSLIYSKYGVLLHPVLASYKLSCSRDLG